MKKIGLVILVVIVVALLGRAYWAYQKTLERTTPSLPLAAAPAAPQGNQVVAAPVQPIVPPPAVAKQIDCKSDFKCLIDAAKQCKKAMLTSTIVAPALVPVLQAKMTWTYQIAGPAAGGQCVSAKRVSDATINYIGDDAAEKATILNSSTFAKMLQSAQSNIGKTSVCTTSNSRLVEMATQLSLGQEGEKASDNCTTTDSTGKPWVPKSVNLTQ